MPSSISNDRLSYTIGTIDVPKLARSLLTLIVWCRIYYVFEIRRAVRSAFYSCKLGLLGKKSYYQQNFLNIASNMQVESSATPLLTIDEVEKVQRQKIARSDMCSTLLIRLWLTNNKLSWIAATVARKDSKKRHFRRFVCCTCMRNASSYPLQQLLNNIVHETSLSREYTSLRGVSHQVS